jgi:hypothetical protein
MATPAQRARQAKLLPERRREIAVIANKARQAKLSPERRREIAVIANKARQAKLSPERRREIAVIAGNTPCKPGRHHGPKGPWKNKVQTESAA